MPSTINADNGVVSGSSGVKTTADTSGVLALQSNGSTGLTLDTSLNVGVGGVTPSAWGSNRTAIQLGGSSGSNFVGGATTALKANNYFDTGDKYVANGFANAYLMNGGTHSWLNAPSGTAGNAITFTQAMTLEGTDRTNLLIGTTSSTFSAATRGVIEIAGSATSLVSLKGGSALAYIFNDGGNLNIQNNSAGVLQLSNNSAVRFQIGSAGQLGIGGATYGSSGQVLTSGGSGAAPTWSTPSAGTTILFAAFSSTGGF